MDKKFLIAVDPSIYTVNALKYAAMIAEKIRDASFSLIHIQPTISDFLMEEAKKNPEALKKIKKQMEKHSDDAITVFEYCIDRFTRFGVSRDRIECYSPMKAQSVASDILNHANQKLYDAIIIGRRGLTKIQEALMGSLTRALLEHSELIPLWVVDGEVDSGRILISVDGSTNSFRAVDHLCFILSGNRDVRITLMHVIPAFGSFSEINFNDKECDTCNIDISADNKKLANFYGLAKKRFSEAGISEKQIEIKIMRCPANVSKAIICEAEKGHYGTIVVGRKKTGSAVFSSSVSRNILESIKNRAVWIVL